MDYSDIYIEFLKKHISVKRPLKVVCDSSNGASGMITRNLTNIPNLELILINDEAHPDFPAHGPNPLMTGATDDAAKKIMETRADFGVILDADGDRAFFVDNKGKIIPSFVISMLLFKHGTPPFVAEELVYKALEHMGILATTEIYPCRVGTFFVKQELKKVHGTIGAEYSGHYYYKDFFGSDSGLFTLITIANVLSQQHKSLSDYCSDFPQHQTVTTDISIRGQTWQTLETKIRSHYSSDKNTVKFETREGLTLDFGDKWINIRSSNTEPLLRLFAGSTSLVTSSQLLEEVKNILIN